MKHMVTTSLLLIFVLCTSCASMEAGNTENDSYVAPIMNGNVAILERDTANCESMQALREAALIGFWHNFRGVPSGFAARYVFFNNYDFAFFANEMNAVPRERKYLGTWRIVGDELELSITTMNILVGGTKEWDPIFGYHWYGSTLETVVLEEPEIRRLTLSNIMIADRIITAYQIGNHKIEIDGEEFWKFNFFDDIYEMFLFSQW